MRVDPPSGRRARPDDAAPVPPAPGRRRAPEDPANRPATPDVAARLGGAAPPPGPRPRPTPPLDADATRYTNAFSGSLPPPPGARPPAPQRRPLPVDPPTELIAPVGDGHPEDGYADDYEDAYEEYDDYEDEAYYDDEQPAPPPDSAARKTVRTIGELLITAGLVILLFVVYEVYVTDLISAGKQGDATEALDEQWNSNTVEADPQRKAQYELLDGQAFAKMYIPAFGPDYKFSIVEGTTDKDLEIGPGHYKGTALPGHPGNFAVAGHRVGKGAPFNDLDLLNPCDAIVVETQTEWIVYRMLPKSGDVAGWAEKQAANAKCAKVSPLGAPYDKTVGQEIVLPTQGEVIDVVPHFAGEPPPEAQQVSLMTLTTCHPRFSDKQRLIVHAVLADTYPKAPGFIPEEMKEQ
ncbi:class E sortase [Saccharothrix isguenensis]